MKLEIIPPKGRNPVYDYYQFKDEPYPAYIKLDCRNAKLYAEVADWNGWIEEDLYDRAVSWEISPHSSCKYINSIFRAIKPLCLEILRGYDEEMINCNWNGVFSKKARECISEITHIIGCRMSSYEEKEYKRSFEDDYDNDNDDD